jgi:hypothetical protein
MAEKEEDKSKGEKNETYEKENRLETVKEIIASGFDEGYFTIDEYGEIASAIMEPLVEKFEKKQLERIYGISIDTDKISDKEIRQSVEDDLNKRKGEVYGARNTLDECFITIDVLTKKIGSLDKRVISYTQIGRTKNKDEKR